MYDDLGTNACKHARHQIEDTHTLTNEAKDRDNIN